MARGLLNLPINIPWTQIAVSPDMIDTRFANKRFPFAWRSSLAISAYEPRPDDLPEDLCDDRITYLKITCSITGFQPTEQETRRVVNSFPDLPTEDLNRILEEYFACYGVLLNVAVFPFDANLQNVPDVGLADYPHIIALEPQRRDLYQSATENAEILTASNNRVATDKTISHTESTETGISATAGYGPGANSPGGSISGTLSHKWGETDQDSKSFQTEASRERRETEGTTTQLSQMYNLLTGYHQGTNRAVFLLLPRPHTLQPTDHRTFVQGLRYIEGIQEFMLIVARPENIGGLCVEAILETGHFPEDVNIQEPSQEFDGRQGEFDVGPITVSNGGIFNPGRKEKTFNETASGFEVDEWEFDPNLGEPGRGGVEEIAKFGDDNADGSTNGPTGGKPAMEGYSYKTETPDQVIVSGKLRSRFTSDTRFHRRYRVHLRRPKTITGEPKADVTKLLMTSRGLNVCIRSGKECPEVVPPILVPPGDGVLFKESIVDERAMRVNPLVLTREAMRESRYPAMMELLRQIQSTMTTSWRLPSRYPAGEVGFLESDYFKERIKKVLPKDHLERHITEVSDLPEAVVRYVGETSTVADALELDLSIFANKTGLSIEEAANARRRLFGIAPEAAEDEDP